MDDARATRAARFLERHRGPGGLVIPNAWDPGSARILEQVGFPYLATTSAGIAFSRGLPDGGLTGAEMLGHVAAIVEAVDCPVTADLEAGYGADPAGVAVTVAAAVAAGVVGANIEDARPGGAPSLFDVDQAAERIAAARVAAPVGSFVLNARTDAYLVGHPDPLAETLARAARYVEAGADCIFVPGVDDPETIRSLAAGIAAPLNVVAGLTGNALDAPALYSLGVARVTVGGSLARYVLGEVERVGRDLLEHGSFRFASGAIAHGDLQRRFAELAAQPPST